MCVKGVKLLLSLISQRRNSGIETEKENHKKIFLKNGREKSGFI